MDTLMSYKSGILYHKTKLDKIQIWHCWVMKDVIHSEFGQLDGKLQVTRKRAEPTNVGRSNERDSWAQAEFEARAMYEHKKSRKYRTSIEACDEPLPMPMLAHKYTERKAKYPAFIQPKLDGVRCMAICAEDGTVSLVSRTGKPYDVQHISDYLAYYIMTPGDWLDGEIYIHGMSRQKIISLVKKVGREGREALQLWVYDMPRNGEEEFRDWTDVPWWRRLWWLGHRQISDLNDKSVRLTATRTINSDEAAWAAHGEYCADGFEGAILRNSEGVYLFGSRSSDLLKLKKFLDDEFEVVGFKEGKGRMVGAVIWRVKCDAGEFNCSMKCTIEERREYFESGNDYIGRYLTVNYQHLSDDGIPQFPVGIVFRPEEDLPVDVDTLEEEDFFLHMQKIIDSGLWGHIG